MEQVNEPTKATYKMSH